MLSVSSSQPADKPASKDSSWASWLLIGIALAAVIALAVVNSTGKSSQSATPVASGETQTIDVGVDGMAFTPSSIDIDPGTHLVVNFTNSGDQVHDLKIGDAETGRGGGGEGVAHDGLRPAHRGGRQEVLRERLQRWIPEQPLPHLVLIRHEPKAGDVALRAVPGLARLDPVLVRLDRSAQLLLGRRALHGGGRELDGLGRHRAQALGAPGLELADVDRLVDAAHPPEGQLLGDREDQLLDGVVAHLERALLC